jgi:hypothetical protein
MFVAARSLWDRVGGVVGVVVVDSGPMLLARGAPLLCVGWPARAGTTNKHNSRLAAERDEYCCTARQLSSRQSTYRALWCGSGVRWPSGVVASIAEKGERLGGLPS